MNATYIPTSFQAENSKHTQAIVALRNALMVIDPTTTFVEHPGKNNLGYDLTINGLNVELKTNAGVSRSNGAAYSTWLLETHTDHAQTIFPEWATTEALDHLVIVNRHTNCAYVYDVKLLRSWVGNNMDRIVASGLGAGQYKAGTTNCGWGIKIAWICEEAGYIGCIELG